MNDSLKLPHEIVRNIIILVYITFIMLFLYIYHDESDFI